MSTFGDSKDGEASGPSWPRSVTRRPPRRKTKKFIKDSQLETNNVNSHYIVNVGDISAVRNYLYPYSITTIINDNHCAARPVRARRLSVTVANEKVKLLGFVYI